MIHSLEELQQAEIKVTKPYKPRKLKMDQVHRLARQLYKLKSKQPLVLQKRRKYEKQYRRKNKLQLKKRSDFVRKIKQHMPQLQKEHSALETYQDYLKRLALLGIKKLGRGTYASVFQHPTNSKLVVKVGIDMSSNHDWLKWSKKKSSNPYVPRVEALYHLRFKNSGQSLPPNSKGYFMAFVEKLTRLNLIDFQDWLNENGLYHTVFKEAGTQEGQMTYWVLEKDWNTHSMDSKLKEVLRFITSFPPDDLDLLQKNFMRRGKQIVFNDPVV